MTLDGGFAAESACVAGVLGDLHLLHLFAEGGPVSVLFGGLVGLVGGWVVGWSLSVLMGKGGGLRTMGEGGEE